MARMTTGQAPRASVTGLLAAAHAPPSLAVTIMATLLGLRAGLTPGRLALLAAAVLTQQFAIGWLNDWWDAEDDVAAGRTDKPVVMGAVSRRTVGVAAVTSAGVSVALSVPLGAAGVVNLLVLAAGWWYDLHAKATALSVVPYLLAFGALPAIATLAAEPPALPPGWMVAAGALLGAGGHFANALPDLEDDRRVGVLGLPQRLGAGRTLTTTAVCLGGGAVVAALGALVGAGPGARTWIPVTALAVSLGLLAAVVVAARRGARRTAFRLTMLLAVVVVAMLVVPL